MGVCIHIGFWDFIWLLFICVLICGVVWILCFWFDGLWSDEVLVNAMKWDKWCASGRLLIVLAAKVLSERRLNVGGSNHDIMFNELHWPMLQCFVQGEKKMMPTFFCGGMLSIYLSNIFFIVLLLLSRLLLFTRLLLLLQSTVCLSLLMVEFRILDILSRLWS